jgi:alpha-acetolactate decarboxylase
MRSNHLTIPICVAAIFVMANGPSLPQQMKPANDVMHTIHQPYGVETFGEFRRIMMGGDFTPKVQLGAAMAKHPTTGVGALADARGEITIYDGKLIVSYGKGGASADANSESAALLAMGSAAEWQSVRVEQDVAPEEIESYIVIAAKMHGIDPEVSFPFEVRGTIGPYMMHVNTAPTNGEHGMGSPMAITVQNHGDRLDGLVAGLYASLDLMGIATHGGERTHAHWISPDLTSTAHLDRWGLKAGSFLMMPKP